MSLIRYPSPLKSSATIGITAPSSGVGQFRPRYEICKRDLLRSGYSVVEGKCLFDNTKAVSASAEQRAKEFSDFWCSEDIDFIFPPWGGEQLIGILEYIDWEKLKSSNPTWILGYSDISLLLAVVTWTTCCATAHGTNLMEFHDKQTDTLTRNALLPLKAKNEDSTTQSSGSLYVKDFADIIANPEALLNTTEAVSWKSFTSEALSIQGRLIGGCIDVLMNVAGTRFDSMPSFARSFKGDGVILYLENCELSPHSFLRALHNLKYADWFTEVNGVVFGRNAAQGFQDYPYEEVLRDFFAPLAIPLIYDADIGHCQPNMTLINGALATVTRNKNGTGAIVQKKA